MYIKKDIEIKLNKDKIRFEVYKNKKLVELIKFEKLEEKGA